LRPASNINLNIECNGINNSRRLLSAHFDRCRRSRNFGFFFNFLLGWLLLGFLLLGRLLFDRLLLGLLFLNDCGWLFFI